MFRMESIKVKLRTTTKTSRTRTSTFQILMVLEDILNPPKVSVTHCLHLKLRSAGTVALGHTQTVRCPLLN